MNKYMKAAETLDEIKIKLENLVKTIVPKADFTDAFDTAIEALYLISKENEEK